jgi:hypothetical protein
MNSLLSLSNNENLIDLKHLLDDIFDKDFISTALLQFGVILKFRRNYH